MLKRMRADANSALDLSMARDEARAGEAGKRTITNPDGYHSINLLDRCNGRRQTRSMRVELPRRPRRPEFLLLVMLVAILIEAPARACAPDTKDAERTTLIVFTRRPMHEDQWQALFTAMRRGLADTGEPQLPHSENVDLLRGTEVHPGLQADHPIVVTLEGDCTLTPRARTTTMGVLGWVLREHGVIAPYIHVECDQLTQVLGPLALGMNLERRDTVMGEAMTRVILHEWVHVVTQSAKHEKEGVSKSAFGIRDLLVDDEAMQHDPRFPQAKHAGKMRGCEANDCGLTYGGR